jgi:hypothetical protein
MRALKGLEASGFITREAQFHDSGARRSSRYYLNHPLAPHCSPRPNPGPSRPDSTRARSQRGTGPVSEGHGTRGAKSGPLDPPSETPTQSPSDAMSVLRAMPQPWWVGGKDARNLIRAIEAAVASGWTTENLTTHLSRSPAGVRNPVRVLARRLADLSDAPAESRPTVAWCGECEDERSRTITVTLPDGTEAAALCPRCSPQGQRQVRKSSTYSYDETEVNQIGGQRV